MLLLFELLRQTQGVYMHSLVRLQLKLDFTGLLSLSQYTSAKGESIIVRLHYNRWWYAPFSWNFFLLAKQATNKLASG